MLNLKYVSFPCFKFLFAEDDDRLAVSPMLDPNSQQFYVDGEKGFNTAQFIGKSTNGHNNELNDIEGT